MVASKPSLWALLATSWRLTLAGPRALWTLLRIALRRGPRERAAIAALDRARAELRRAGDPPPEPLRQVSPDVFEVDAPFLGEADAPPLGVTVVHLLGSGEVLHAPLPGLRRQCHAQPLLRRCRHLIADTTRDAGAFLGADEFAVRMGHTLRGALHDCSDELVFVGLSRGALAALELGARHGAELERPTQVLANAAPVRRDYALPRIVADLAALEPAMHLLALALEYPTPLSPLWRAWLRRLFVRNTGFVLAELQMDDAELIGWYARYAETRPAAEICLRALREFALLARASDAELRHVLAGITAHLLDAPDVHVTLCWGERDAWVPPGPCRDRAHETLQRAGVPEAQYALHLLPGFNHGIGRQRHASEAQLAGLMAQACMRAAGQRRDTERGAAHASQ